MWEFVFALLDRGFGWAKNRSDFRIEGEEYLDRNHYSYADLLKRLIGLDHATLPGVNPMNEGTVEQWVPIFKADPEAWRLLVFRKKIIAGYFSAFSLTDEAYAEIQAGSLADSELSADMIKPLDEPGLHKLYVCTLIGLHDFDAGGDRVADRIFRALVRHLLRLGKQGTLIEEICATAFSEDGERICRKVGLIKVEGWKSHQGGTLYRAKLIPLSETTNQTAIARKLAKVYRAKNPLH